MKNLKDLLRATASTDGKNDEMLPVLTLYDKTFQKLVLVPLDPYRNYPGEGKVMKSGEALYAVVSRPNKRALLVPVRQGYGTHSENALYLNSTYLYEGSTVTLTFLKFADEDESENKY